MVQITQSNLLGTTTSGRLLPSQVAPDSQKVNNANMLQGAVDRASGILDKIVQTAEDQQVNKALTDAQVEFARQFDERSSMVSLEDGSPAEDTLDEDLVSIGREVSSSFSKGIVGNRNRDKFNLLLNNFIANKRIQGFGIARTQKVNRATGDFYATLDNLTKQASNPNNADLSESFIKQANSTIDGAVENQLITSKQGVAFKKSFSEGTHESLLRQAIDSDPLTALALLDSDKDLGVDPATRIQLKKLAKTTLNTLRTNKNTIATQKTNGAKMQMESLELSMKDIIDTSPIAGMPGGVGWSDVETVFKQIDNLSIIHTDDEIKAERDPVQQQAMIDDNVVAIKYATLRKAEIKNKFNERNKQARKDADRVQKNQRDMKLGLSLPASEAQFMYRQQSAGQTMDTKVKLAELYKQPLPSLQNEMITAVTTGNLAALGDAQDEDGNIVPGVLSAYARLKETSPRSLKGMSENDINKMSYLTALVGAGTPLESAVTIVNDNFNKLDSARRNGFRAEFRKNDDNGKSLRNYILDRTINKVAGLTSGISDATPQFLHQATTIAELMYQVHGDKDAAADATAVLMQDAGATTFPVKSQGFFSNNQEIMLATPEKVMGWTDQESKIAVSKFKSEFAPVAKINGINTDNIYIESDSATVRMGRPHTWAVWGVTDNGSHVSLGRYQPSTKEDLVKHNLQQSYAKRQEEDKELKAFRDRFGVSEADPLLGTKTKPKIQAKAKAEVKRLQEVSKRNVIRSRVDAVTGAPKDRPLPEATVGPFTGPTIPTVMQGMAEDFALSWEELQAKHKDADDFINKWNVRIWESVTPKIARFLNKYIIEPLAPREAGAAEARPMVPKDLDKTMVDYGQRVVHQPQKAQEMFFDAQFEDSTEAEPDDIDGSINTTGLSTEDVADRHMDRMLDDSRHLTGASNSVFANKLEEDEFNTAVTMLHENVASPEQVFPHESAMKYLASKKNLDGTEREYVRKSDKRAEKFGGSTAPSDSLIPDDVMQKINSDPLLSRVYESEQFRPRAYRDQSKNNPKHKDGFLTIGIGWNIEPGDNDAANESLVNWLNSVNAGKRQYDLGSLQSGRQKITPEDAVMVLQRQVRSAGFDAGKWVGTGMFNLSIAQQRVVSDMSFHLGMPTLRGFGAFRRAINGTTKNDPKNPFNHVKDTMVRAPLEIINSTAFKSQTPIRYMEHLVNWVNGSNLTKEQRQKVKKEATKFINARRITNITGKESFNSKVLALLNNI